MNVEILLASLGSVLAFVAAWFATRSARRWLLARGVLDVPGGRSSHEKPTPRGGGVAIVGSFLICFVLVPILANVEVRAWSGLLLVGLAAAAMGFAEDALGIPVGHRLLLFLGVTALAVVFGLSLTGIALPVVGVLSFGPLSLLLTFLWLAGFANLFNFMDGIDGIAGSQAVSFGFFMAIIAHEAGRPLVFLCATLLAAATLGFLLHNWPPSSIFMGDVGSYFLGVMLAVIAIEAAITPMAAALGEPPGEAIPFVVSLLLLAPFVFDATWTLLRRLVRGVNVFQPHREHLYQRLIIVGYSHATVTKLYTTLNAAFGMLALVYFFGNEQARTVVLVLGLVVLFCLALGTNIVESKLQTGSRTPAGNAANNS